MSVTTCRCLNCYAVLDPIETYLNCDGEPVRDTRRECAWCGSRSLLFEEVEPGSRCECCWGEDGYRDAEICRCGKALCPVCFSAHEHYPHLCAGRFAPAFPNCSGTAHFGNPDPTEEEAR